MGAVSAIAPTFLENSHIDAYSPIPNKRVQWSFWKKKNKHVGPNKRVGWIFKVNFLRYTLSENHDQTQQ